MLNNVKILLAGSQTRPPSLSLSCIQSNVSTQLRLESPQAALAGQNIIMHVGFYRDKTDQPIQYLWSCGPGILGNTDQTCTVLTCLADPHIV